MGKARLGINRIMLVFAVCVAISQQASAGKNCDSVITEYDRNGDGITDRKTFRYPCLKNAGWEYLDEDYDGIYDASLNQGDPPVRKMVNLPVEKPKPSGNLAEPLKSSPPSALSEEELAVISAYVNAQGFGGRLDNLAKKSGRILAKRYPNASKEQLEEYKKAVYFTEEEMLEIVSANLLAMYSIDELRKLANFLATDLGQKWLSLRKEEAKLIGRIFHEKWYVVQDRSRRELGAGQ